MTDDPIFILSGEFYSSIFHQPSQLITESFATPSYYTESEKNIIVISVGPILSPGLLRYLRTRNIPIKLANRFCCEVHYQLYKKRYYAIGFETDGGGFELRNTAFKGSSKPKTIKFVDRGFYQVEVFEGFFSFLSFLTVIKNWEQLSSNFLILNSLSLFRKSCELMEKHDVINLHLDRDKAGIKKTNEAQARSSKYRNASIAYLGYKDWNKYLLQERNLNFRLKRNSPTRRYVYQIQNKAKFIPKKPPYSKIY